MSTSSSPPTTVDVPVVTIDSSPTSTCSTPIIITENHHSSNNNNNISSKIKSNDKSINIPKSSAIMVSEVEIEQVEVVKSLEGGLGGLVLGSQIDIGEKGGGDGGKERIVEIKSQDEEMKAIGKDEKDVDDDMNKDETKKEKENDIIELSEKDEQEDEEKEDGEVVEDEKTVVVGGEMELDADVDTDCGKVVKIENLGRNVTDSFLLSLFSPFGKILNLTRKPLSSSTSNITSAAATGTATAALAPAPATATTGAFLKFEHAEDAGRAVQQLNGAVIFGLAIRVQLLSQQTGLNTSQVKKSKSTSSKTDSQKPNSANQSAPKTTTATVNSTSKPNGVATSATAAATATNHDRLMSSLMSPSALPFTSNKALSDVLNGAFHGGGASYNHRHNGPSSNRNSINMRPPPSLPGNGGNGNGGRRNQGFVSMVSPNGVGGNGVGYGRSRSSRAGGPSSSPNNGGVRNHYQQSSSLNGGNPNNYNHGQSQSQGHIPPGLTTAAHHAAAHAQHSKENASNLYVLNLPLDMSNEELEEIFEGFGKVVHCCILATLDNFGRRRAFIDMEEGSSAKIALQKINNCVLRSYRIDVSYALVQRSGGPLVRTSSGPLNQYDGNSIPPPGHIPSTSSNTRMMAGTDHPMGGYPLGSSLFGLGSSAMMMGGVDTAPFIPHGYHRDFGTTRSESTTSSAAASDATATASTSAAVARALGGGGGGAGGLKPSPFEQSYTGSGNYGSGSGSGGRPGGVENSTTDSTSNMTSLFVTNISPCAVIDSADLAALFSPFGDLVTAVLRINSDGSSRQCGKVVYGIREDAEKAIAGMDGHFVGGKRLGVNWWKEREPLGNANLPSSASSSYSTSGISNFQDSPGTNSTISNSPSTPYLPTPNGSPYGNWPFSPIGRQKGSPATAAALSMAMAHAINNNNNNFSNNNNNYNNNKSSAPGGYPAFPATVFPFGLGMPMVNPNAMAAMAAMSGSGFNPSMFQHSLAAAAAGINNNNQYLPQIMTSLPGGDGGGGGGGRNVGGGGLAGFEDLSGLRLRGGEFGFQME